MKLKLDLLSSRFHVLYISGQFYTPWGHNIMFCLKPYKIKIKIKQMMYYNT